MVVADLEKLGAQMSELLPLAKMARRLGVTANWLKGQADADFIPHLKAGNRYLFNSQAVIEVLAVAAAGETVKTDSSPEGGPDAGEQ